MKKNIVLILFFLCVGCSSKMTYQKIDNQKLAQVMSEQEEVVLIDVRSFDEFKSGHIENAINIPVDGITVDTMRNIENDSYIVLYCQSGNRSKQAAEKLIELGYINVYDYGSINNYNGNIIKETDN